MRFSLAHSGLTEAFAADLDTMFGLPGVMSLGLVTCRVLEATG